MGLTDADSCTVERPEWHTYLMAGLALGTAMFAVLVDGASVRLVLLLAIGLIPWAVVASGIRLRLWIFVLATLVPAGFAVLTPAPGCIFFGLITVMFVTSQTSNRGLTVMTVGGALLLPALCSTFHGGEEAKGNWYFAAGILFAWFCGHLLRRQYELVAELRATQIRMSTLAAADERRRIAREIHDIVAHSLTVVVLNVGGARRAMAVDPEGATEALQRAEDVGRQALDDIRQTVGLLRDESVGVRRAPADVAPGADAIPQLVAGYRAAGMRVSLDVEGDLARVDPVTGTTLYRVAQEALSNVSVHAPGAAAAVVVVDGPRSVDLRVHNGAPTAPVAAADRQGLGLVGMRERISSRGGTLSAGAARDGWLIACSLPHLDAPRCGGLLARLHPDPSPAPSP